MSNIEELKESELSFQVFRDSSIQQEERIKHGKALIKRNNTWMKTQYQVLFDVITAELQDRSCLDESLQSQWWSLMAELTEEVVDITTVNNLYIIRKRFIKELIDSLNEFKFIEAVDKIIYSILVKESFNTLTCLNTQDQIMMLCGLVKCFYNTSIEHTRYYLRENIERLASQINSVLNHSSFNTQLSLTLISDLLPTLLTHTDDSDNLENDDIFVKLVHLLSTTIIQKDSLKYVDKYFSITKDIAEPENSTLLYEKGVNVFTELFNILKGHVSVIISDFFIRYTSFKGFCSKTVEFLFTCIKLSLNTNIQPELTLKIWSLLLQHSAENDVFSYLESDKQTTKKATLTFIIEALLQKHSNRISKYRYICIKSLIKLDHTVIIKSINTLLTTVLYEHKSEEIGYSDECMCEIVELYHRLRQTDKFISIYCQLITTTNNHLVFQPKSAECLGEVISQTSSATVVKIMDSILNSNVSSVNYINLLSIIMYNMKMYDNTTPHTVKLQLVDLMVKIKDEVLTTLLNSNQLSLVILFYNYISVFDILKIYCEELHTQLTQLEPGELHERVKNLIIKSLQDDIKLGELETDMFNYMIKLLTNIEHNKQKNSTIESLNLISKYCTERGQIELTTLNCILSDSGMIQLLIETKTNNVLNDMIQLVTQMYLLPNHDRCETHSIIDKFLSSVLFLESSHLHTALLTALTILVIASLELFTQPSSGCEEEISQAYFQYLDGKILEKTPMKQEWEDDAIEIISTELNKFLSDYDSHGVTCSELIDTIFSCVNCIPIEELSKLQIILLSVNLIFLTKQTSTDKQRVKELHSLQIRLLTNQRSSHFITSLDLKSLTELWNNSFSEIQMNSLYSALVKLYFHTNNITQLKCEIENEQLTVITMYYALQHTVESDEYLWGKSKIKSVVESSNVTTNLKSSEFCSCLTLILGRETGHVTWISELTYHVLQCLKTNSILNNLNSDQQTALVKLLTVLTTRENRPTRFNLCVQKIPDEVYIKYLNSVLTRADNSQFTQLHSQLMAAFKDGFQIGLTDSLLCWKNLISCSFKNEDQEQLIVEFIQQAMKLLTVNIGDKLLSYSIYPDPDYARILSYSFLEYFHFFSHITRKGRPFITSQNISRIFQQLHLLNFNQLNPRIIFRFITGIVEFLQSAILNFETFVLKSAPALIDIVKKLLLAIVKFGDQQLINNYTRSDESEHEIESNLINCCHEINKLMTVVVKHKTEINKLTPYIICDFVDGLSTVTLLPSVKKRLLLCLNPLFDISDEHSIMLLKTNLDDGPRQVFITIHEQYTKFHRYTGRV